jgi:hypothetical protein
MVARFQQIYCVQQTYRGFIAALSGEYWARLWTKVEGHRRSFIEARRVAENIAKLPELDGPGQQ